MEDLSGKYLRMIAVLHYWYILLGGKWDSLIFSSRGLRPPRPPTGRRKEHKGLWILGETKSQEVETNVWVAPVAVGGPQANQPVVPGTATDHALVTIAFLALKPG